ncbi:tRNA uridine-5-carboxymethylaminomethyl(34) synthesis GTPase MnmE [Fastidiosibacter lacustris]|uniref:tRNA uridine-5-carboxymethylaminomethyl(34) synthesis GTPase MnmE n=1 Tax=Fastidiosibacter lacustris TaxID=2056695 RepID=UPI000E34AE5F|nr:tRNA uridine-5-carboxymethylaminomethyl(34) synthesis GTPase MnmE [Fastidiosibacter lacustris]
MSVTNDTIAAIATAPGRGGVGIIRISGEKAYAIAYNVTKTWLKPRYAHFLTFKNHQDELLDQGIAIYFKAPYSYTGEDVVELQAHGGPILLNLILQTTLEYGARLAKPGEFTERAYLNDKIDLAQAEAIADIIDASSEQAAKSAMRSLQGEFSKHIDTLVHALIQLRVHVEAAIDFPEEEIDFLADPYIEAQLNTLYQQLNFTLENSKQGALLREGVEIVIAGKPNAGKSSLLNALAGKETAIVTDIEGTTRDTLREYIQINGIPVHIIDTAGLRISDNVVENEGIRRALEAIKKADHILLVADIRDTIDKEITELAPEFFKHIPNYIPITYIYNKIDLRDNDPQNHDNYLYISAKHGIGINKLRDYLLRAIGYTQTNEGVFTARKRHINALNAAKEHLEIAQLHLQHKDGELLAEELNLAQGQLSSITGEFNADDLLGEIFSNFCIGK